jgi:transposase InsO family protein
VRFAWIDEHRDDFELGAMCRVLAVTRGGYYAWKEASATPGPRQERREEIVGKIREIHGASDATYGSPRVHRELAKQGVKINRKTVEKLMKQHEISPVSARRFVPQTTDSDHDHPVAENLLDRQFTADAPNRKWVTDITYVWTDEGWMYLAGVMDLYSRRVVGWAMADHMRAELCVEALRMAVASRRPEPGLLHHSDRGSQYASEAYRAALDFHGMTASMSRGGNCYDNAVMESFWGTLKRERLNRLRFATREEARSAIFEWIEAWYNRKRSHSSLGYVSPEAFEAGRN